MDNEQNRGCSQHIAQCGLMRVYWAHGERVQGMEPKTKTGVAVTSIIREAYVTLTRLLTFPECLRNKSPS